MNTRCILFFDTLWGAPLEIPEGLADDFHLTTNRWRFAEADAVVFHIPEWRYGVGANMPKKPHGQIWVAWSMECEENYPLLRDGDFMGHFDVTMTYHLDADIPVIYVDSGFDKSFRTPVHSGMPNALVAAFISSDCNRSGRQEYFKELARWLPIDSYGKYLRNKLLPRDLGAISKLETISRYKFTLAFENACGRDYVTEKFYDPLIAGSVPVYLGAPNIDAFAPGKQCFIDTRDFADPKSLAGHILRLASDSAAYSAYRVWKTEPYREAFRDLLTLQRTHPFVRLCDCVRKRLAC